MDVGEALACNPLRATAHAFIAPQGSFNLLQRLVFVEKTLAYNACHTAVETKHDFLRQRLGRHDDHRYGAQRRLRLHGLEYANSVQLGHHQVEQQQVWQHALHQVQRLPAVACFEHAHMRQPPPNHLRADAQDVKFVVHQQDGGRLHRRLSTQQTVLLHDLCDCWQNRLAQAPPLTALLSHLR